MAKEDDLKALEAEMAAARLPLETNLVFGEGNPDTKLLFIGEAPGRDEDAQRRPFVGRGGQLLRECIRASGFAEKDVYITNIVKRRPPENRDPLPEEIQAYQPYLARQIEIIAAPIIVTLGRFAMNYFLPAAKITRDQGKIFRMNGRCVVPMLHPAAALRSPDSMTAFRETFSKLSKIVEKCEALLKEPPAAPGADQPKPRAQKLF